MSRFAAAVVIFALGLAVGLWLGFDPQARAAVEENYERATTSIIQVRSDIGLQTDSAPAEQSDTGAPAEEAPGGAPIDRISSFLNEVWEGVKQAWSDLLVRFNAGR